jgi:hypothetical protein
VEKTGAKSNLALRFRRIGDRHGLLLSSSPPFYRSLSCPVSYGVGGLRPKPPYPSKILIFFVVFASSCDISAVMRESGASQSLAPQGA